jgi:hypothetical protein
MAPSKGSLEFDARVKQFSNSKRQWQHPLRLASGRLSRPGPVRLATIAGPNASPTEDPLVPTATLPRQWNGFVQAAILQVISLAHYAMI